MTARKIIIDTDPGQDDALAIFCAFGARAEIEVIGITTVAGNVPLELTSRNARILCELAGREDVPVHAGAIRPLMRDLITAEHVHGRTGLDGPELDEPQMALGEGHAVEFLIKTLREASPGEITLCPIGPLTNLALAIAEAPDIIPRIREIVLMGGAYSELGNVSPTAEFNFYVDPEAAKIVFSSGAPITMMPLDVTHKILTTKARGDAFRAIGNKVGEVAAELTTHYERFDVEKYGGDGAPLHDPAVILWLLAPEIFDGKRVNVEIETSSELCRGMSVVDWWGTSGRKANAMVIRDVDDQRFYEILIEKLAALP